MRAPRPASAKEAGSGVGASVIPVNVVFRLTGVDGGGEGRVARRGREEGRLAQECIGRERNIEAGIRPGPANDDVVSIRSRGDTRDSLFATAEEPGANRDPSSSHRHPAWVGS